MSNTAQGDPGNTSTPRGAPLPVKTIGTPVAISGLARLLLRMHQQQQRPALHLVTPPESAPHDEPRRAVPALEQGPL